MVSIFLCRLRLREQALWKGEICGRIEFVELMLIIMDHQNSWEDSCWGLGMMWVWGVSQVPLQSLIGLWRISQNCLQFMPYTSISTSFQSRCDEGRLTRTHSFLLKVDGNLSHKLHCNYFNNCNTPGLTEFILPTWKFVQILCRFK